MLSSALPSSHFCIESQACSVGTVMPLVPAMPSAVWPMPVHLFEGLPLPHLSVGTRLNNAYAGSARTENAHLCATPLFEVVGFVWLPPAGLPHAWPCPLLRALAPVPAGQQALCPSRQGWAMAWITLSDKGAAGLRQDESGPLMGTCVREKLHLCHEQGFIVPDDPYTLAPLVMELALHQGYDLIITSGGTGLAPRDTTPETLIPLLERRLPGFEQAMMLASLAKTPHAAISRAVAGTLHHTLILALPGSRKAVAENLEAVLPALEHALDKLHGDPRDCGQ